MTPDISQLLIFNPDLTIEQYLRMMPKPVDKEVITRSSAINDMVGCSNPRKPRNTSREMAHRKKHDTLSQVDLLTAYKTMFLQAKRMRRY